MDAGHLLTNRDFQRVGDAVRRVEGTYNIAGESAEQRGGSNVQVLQIQAGAANDFGYPARIQKWSNSAGTWSDLSATEVRVEDANGGVFAATGYVVARFVGINAANVGCFSAGASASGISVTDGTTTVTGVTALTLSPDTAWTISGTSPNATATVLYTGGGDGTLGVNSDKGGIIGGGHYGTSGTYSNGYLSSGSTYYGYPLQKMGTGCKLFDYVGVGPTVDTVFPYCLRPSSVIAAGNMYYSSLYVDSKTAAKIMSMTDAATAPAISGWGDGLQGFGALQVDKVFMVGQERLGDIGSTAGAMAGVMIEDSSLKNLAASGYFPYAATSTNWNVFGVLGWSTGASPTAILENPGMPGMMCFTFSGYGTPGGPPASSNFRSAVPTNLSTQSSLLWVPGRVVANSGYSSQELDLGVVTMYDGQTATVIGMKFVGGLYISGSPTFPFSVSQGGTGATTFTAGQLIAGNGTSALDPLTSTRISGEELELRLGADQWIGFTSGSF